VAMNRSHEETAPVHALRLWKGTGKRISMGVETGSMAPVIRPGDAVEISMVSADRVRSGDIVAYLQHGRVIVHRLIRQDQSPHRHRLWQQGDSLLGWGSFESADFIGRVDIIRQGAVVLNMDQGIWPRMNRVLGRAGRAKMGLAAILRRVRETALGGRLSPVAAGMWHFVSGLLGRMKRLFISAALHYKKGRLSDCLVEQPDGQPSSHLERAVSRIGEKS
jgi:hypothetical protein